MHRLRSDTPCITPNLSITLAANCPSSNKSHMRRFVKAWRRHLLRHNDRTTRIEQYPDKSEKKKLWDKGPSRNLPVHTELYRNKEILNRVQLLNFGAALTCWFLPLPVRIDNLFRSIYSLIEWWRPTSTFPTYISFCQIPHWRKGRRWSMCIEKGKLLCQWNRKKRSYSDSRIRTGNYTSLYHPRWWTQPLKKNGHGWMYITTLQRANGATSCISIHRDRGFLCRSGRW